MPIRILRRPAALVIVALIGLTSVGCGSNTASAAGSTGSENPARAQAVKFAECMRENGVPGFPDPDASGALTVDDVVNGSSLDPNGPTWKKAIEACKDLQPPGFTGHKRSAVQQGYALEFAQCMRDNGVKDFPDPSADDPLIDTERIPSLAGKDPRNVPGFDAATHKCGSLYADELGLKGP